MQQAMYARGIETKHGVSVCVRGDLHLALWREPVTKEAWDHYAAMMDRAIAANPEGTVVAISIIDPRSSPPTIRQRMAIQEDFKRWEKLRRYITGVVGDGIFARVVRAFVRTSLLAIRPGQQVFFEKPSEIFTHLKQFSTDRTPSEREVTSCIRYMQEQLGMVVLPPET